MGKLDEARAVLAAGLAVDARLHIPLALFPSPQVRHHQRAPSSSDVFATAALRELRAIALVLQ
jgi:hypothetical protein